MRPERETSRGAFDSSRGIGFPTVSSRGHLLRAGTFRAPLAELDAALAVGMTALALCFPRRSMRRKDEPRDARIPGLFKSVRAWNRRTIVA